MEPPKTEALLQKWTQFAPDYTEHMERHFYHLYVSMLQMLELCALATEPAPLLLDVGCGGGFGLNLASAYAPITQADMFSCGPLAVLMWLWRLVQVCVSPDTPGGC